MTKQIRRQTGRQVGRHRDKERSRQTVRQTGAHRQTRKEIEGEGKEILSEKGAEDRAGVSDRS